MQRRPLPRRSLLKVPHQARAVETVHALLDAALRVLEEEPPEAFGTARVAAVAGLGPGTLYQYLSNREALLAAVLERGLLEAAQRVEEALEAPRDGSLAGLLGEVVEALVAHFEPHVAALARTMALAPLAGQEAVGAVLEPRIMDAIREHLLRRGGGSRLLVGSPGLFVAVNGALFVLFKWLAERPPQVSRAALIAAVVEQAGAVLAAEDPGADPARA